MKIVIFKIVIQITLIIKITLMINVTIIFIIVTDDHDYQFY